jgi:hypothetical protein
MTHLQKFINAMKSTNSAKALALIAIISSPDSSYSATLPSSFPPDRTITQLAEDTASVPAIVGNDTERKIEKLSQESQALARDTFLFLDKLRTNQRYSQIYARDIPASVKLELVKQLLNEDFAAFNLATNRQYGDLAQFNDSEKTAALKTLPGMVRHIEKVSETIIGIREVMMSLRQSTAEGPNRADQGAVFANDIQLAVWKLSAALAAIEQRYEEPASNAAVVEQTPTKQQDQWRAFGI